MRGVAFSSVAAVEAMLEWWKLEWAVSQPRYVCGMK